MTIHSPKLIAAVMALLVMVLMGGSVLVDKSALRDESDANNKAYSLARVQLWWWTMIILGSYVMAYGLTGDFWKLSAGCTVLLGISAATTTAGRIIDVRDGGEPSVTRHQETPSKGFFIDILSDQAGVSVHRFQMVMFNVIYGLSFLVRAFSDLHQTILPDFDPATLSLLGVSSATYLALKSGENRSSAPGAMVALAPLVVEALPAPAPASDELLDPNPAREPELQH